MRSVPFLLLTALTLVACGRNRQSNYGGSPYGGGGYPAGGGEGYEGGAPAADRSVLPHGQGWSCFRDRQLKAWSYCERSFDGCRSFRDSLIQDDAAQGKVADLTDCAPQGEAMCHTYYNKQAGKMGWSCSITMVDCQDSTRYYSKKTEKFSNVSRCEGI